MIRTIRLYGSLEKAAGTKAFQFDCDNQHQLFAALKGLYPAVETTLRQMKTFSICWTETEEERNPKPVSEGFRFSDKAKYLHISPATEGAWWYALIFIASVVVSYAITRLTMPRMNSNNGGAATRSTMFNGPVNTTDQGNPIPIVYGKEVLVGSQIVATDEDYVNLL